MTSISIINCGKASARQLASAGFDYVLAMDRTNLEAFGAIAPARHSATVALFLS